MGGYLGNIFARGKKYADVREHFNELRFKRLQRNQKIAKNFRDFLYSHFVSQNDFAQTMGLTRSAVAHYCSGDAEVPASVICLMQKMFPNEIRFYDFRRSPEKVVDKET